MRVFPASVSLLLMTSFRVTAQEVPSEAGAVEVSQEIFTAVEEAAALDPAEFYPTNPVEAPLMLPDLSTPELIHSGPVTAPSQLLRGPQADGRVGDIRLDNGRCTFIFSALDHPLYSARQGGALIDASLSGSAFDRLGEIRTAIGPSLSRFPVNTSITLAEDGGAVVVEGHDETSPEITVRTTYRLDPEFAGLIITSELVNGTQSSLEGWSAGDFVHWGSTSLFLMETAGIVFRPGFQTFTPAAIAFGREFSLAMTGGEGVPTEIISHTEYARLFYGRSDVAPGETLTATRRLFMGLESMDTVAPGLWSALGYETGTLEGEIVDAIRLDPIPGAELLVNQRQAGPRPLLRVLTDARGRFSVPLPAGMQVLGIPRAYTRTRPTQAVPRVEVASGEVVYQRYELNPPALVEFHVTDSSTGERLPVRATILDPQGRPADLGPLDSGIQAGPHIFVPTGEGRYEVPPGQFNIVISHGPEYSRWEQEVFFFAGAIRRFEIELERLVDTAGYVAADFGLLTNHSHQSLVAPADRLRTAACEGLEFLVSTDVNHVTDLGASLAEAGLDLPLTVASGLRIPPPELSPRGTWTAFPVPPDFDVTAFHAETQGASHRTLLSALRHRLPDSLITCLAPSHPDESIFPAMGYRHVPQDFGWERTTPASPEDVNFDLMEVFGNRDRGDYLASRDLWYTLLREGHRVMVSASPNSRFAGVEEIGVPRVYVAADDSDPRQIDPEEVFRSLRAGNAFISTGPFVHFEVMGHPLGSMIQWEVGEPVEIDLRVIAPVEQRLEYVEVNKNGLFARRHMFVQPVTSPVYDWSPPEDGRLYQVRSDEIFTIEVGSRRPLSPVNALNASNETFLPMALTNPIWIDTDSNGRYDFSGQL